VTGRYHGTPSPRNGRASQRRTLEDALACLHEAFPGVDWVLLDGRIRAVSAPVPSDGSVSPRELRDLWPGPAVVPVIGSWRCSSCGRYQLLPDRCEFCHPLHLDAVRRDRPRSWCP
jgi:hypothetical protein